MNYIYALISWLMYIKEKIINIKHKNQIEYDTEIISELNKENAVLETEVEFVKKEREIERNTDNINKELKNKVEKVNSVIDEVFSNNKSQKERQELNKGNTQEQSKDAKKASEEANTLKEFNSKNIDFSIKKKKGKNNEEQDGESYTITI